MKNVAISILIFLLVIVALKYLWPLIVLGFKVFIVLSVASLLKLIVALVFIAGFFLLVTH